MTAPDAEGAIVGGSGAPHGPGVKPGRGLTVIAVSLAYVLPLGLFTTLLIAEHLTGIALALLAVEACVVLACTVARRRPQRRAGMAPASRRPWIVPLIMVLLVGCVVAVAMLAAAAG